MTPGEQKAAIAITVTVLAAVVGTVAFYYGEYIASALCVAILAWLWAR